MLKIKYPDLVECQLSIKGCKPQGLKEVAAPITHIGHDCSNRDRSAAFFAGIIHDDRRLVCPWTQFT
jgi:hypothetical protein